MKYLLKEMLEFGIHKHLQENINILIKVAYLDQKLKK